MTEAAERPGRRQRSLHCKPAEQAMIRERAAAAEKTVSRYVMELALADDPDRHPLVLLKEEVWKRNRLNCGMGCGSCRHSCWLSGASYRGAAG